MFAVVEPGGNSILPTQAPVAFYNMSAHRKRSAAQKYYLQARLILHIGSIIHY